VTTEFDAEVRTALHELADEAKPVYLTRRALRGAGWIRARRNVLSAVAAISAVGVVATPYLVLRDRHPWDNAGPVPAATSPSSAAPTPVLTPPPRRDPPSVTEPAVAMPGGWYLSGGSTDKGVVIWDRVRQRYRTLEFERALPAPVGELVAVQNQRRIGVLNLRTDTVRWLTTGRDINGGDWTADGRRLTYGVGITEGLEIMVADAVRGSARKLFQVECIEGCSPVWLSGDAEIAMPLPGASAQMQAYSATNGHPTRKLPWWVGPRQAWSPDGAHVVVGGQSGSAGVVIEVATGKRVAELTVVDYRTVYWVDEERLLAIERGGVAVLRLNGTRQDFFPWPREMVEDELPNFTLSRA
jgi:hypothetical protein